MPNGKRLARPMWARRRREPGIQPNPLGCALRRSPRGILGAFPLPNDAGKETEPPVRGRGILAQLDRWGDPQTSSIGRGLLAPLERLNNPANHALAAWLQSAMPFAAGGGSFSKSMAQNWVS